MDIESRQPPTRVILEHARPWGRWSTRAAWIVAGLAVLSAIGSAGAFSLYFQRDAAVVEKYHSLSKTAPGKVAIVSVSGAILGGDGFVRAQLDQVAADEAVKVAGIFSEIVESGECGDEEAFLRAVAEAAGLECAVCEGLQRISRGYGVRCARACEGLESAVEKQDVAAVVEAEQQVLLYGSMVLADVLAR